jgi:hypothetical protein
LAEVLTHRTKDQPELLQNIERQLFVPDIATDIAPASLIIRVHVSLPLRLQ